MFHIYTRLYNTSCEFFDIQNSHSPMEISIWFFSVSNPSFNFNFMSNFKLPTLTKTNSDFFLSKLPPITDVPIVSFMKTLDEIDN